MRLGTFDIERGLLLAPMEDVTDLPFRLLCKRLGADIVYTEYVNSQQLLGGVPRARAKLLFSPEERPFGIQIYGGDPHTMAEAARLAASFEPDLLDINCGCWIKDVASRGAGAALLRDLPRMERIAVAVVGAVSIPVTLKTRLGWDAQSIRIVELARMCEASGIQALTVHCRTRDQGHKGAVDWSWIPRVKAAVTMPIVLNGGVESAADVERAFDTTGCDAIMIGRAAVANPRLFAEAKHYLAHGVLPPEPTPAERLALVLQHLRLAVRHLGEDQALNEVRKHYTTMLRGMPDVSAIRSELRRSTSAAAIFEHLSRFLDLYQPARAADFSVASS